MRIRRLNEYLYLFPPEQNGGREVGGAAQGKTDQQSTEDESTPYKSTSSKLSRSPIKVAKKPKNMQCKITLLDGSDYTCVVEVSEVNSFFPLQYKS